MVKFCGIFGELFTETVVVTTDLEQNYCSVPGWQCPVACDVSYTALLLYLFLQVLTTILVEIMQW